MTPTRDELLRLAQDAGLGSSDESQWHAFAATSKAIERFAELLSVHQAPAQESVNLTGFPALMNALLTCGNDTVIQAAHIILDWYQGVEPAPYSQPVSGAVDQIALEAATNILPMYFEAIPGGQLKAKIQCAVIDAISRAQQAPAIEYTPGEWFKARTLDEMQAFYLHRLPAIREAAKAHGYALGLHGSMRRDFDLMAMQWRADASDKDTLAHSIAVAACGITREGAHQWEQKPNGRFAVSIPICWTDHANPDFKNKLSIGHIDLSVIEPAAAPVREQAKCAVCSYEKAHMIHTEFGTHAYVAREQTKEPK